MEKREDVHELGPIAILGVGCRFPGADGPRELWRLLAEGRDAIGEVPRSRFDVDPLYDPSGKTAGKVVTRWGGFLDDIERFDAEFFGISPREAIRMDPQQRLLLEATWNALEDAGLRPDELRGSRTGAFVGLCYSEFEDLQLADLAGMDLYSTVGGFRSATSGRISHAFDFRGPNSSVDSACASSLVALHQACQSLRHGSSTLAIAGGVNVVLQPMFTVGYSRAGMLSPEGRCKAFDASANGFVRSDGVGAVVLKRLSTALEDGDRILAVIRGSAVNNDGCGSGLLMTPSAVGQAEVLRTAYEAAGVPPASVDYVEAHGTGTPVGDPVEAESLGTVLTEGRDPSDPLPIGSVKSNFGHTEGAAGMAGLVKAILMLHHRALPPSLHCDRPNPQIPWRELGLKVQTSYSEWPTPPVGEDGGRPARIGVNSFGISGVNAHVVLEEAPSPGTSDAEAERELTDGRAWLLPVSSHHPEALTEMARRYADRVSELEGDAAGLADLVASSALYRTHHRYRLAVAGRSREELAEGLRSFVDREAHPLLAADLDPPRRSEPDDGAAESDGSSGVVFVFSGQGSQWAGMARGLLAEEPVFREALERCDRAIRKEAGWSVIEELEAGDRSERRERIDVVQPSLFAVSVALAALWRSWGVEPRAVLGLSMGEAAAAHVSGHLGLEDAVRVICGRSRLMRRVSGDGAMAATDLSLDEARDLVAKHDGAFSVAVSNSASSTVLSGDPEALEEVRRSLEAEDRFCRIIQVDVASHSPQMDELREPLAAELDGLEARRPEIPMISTVRARRVEEGELDAAYWVDNLREPVLFARVVDSLIDEHSTLFVEMSPHPLQSNAVREQLRLAGEPGAALPSLRREEDEGVTLRVSLGRLYALGHEVDWDAVAPGGARRVDLPLHAFRRRRLWPVEEGRPLWPPGGSTAGAGRSHPLLGGRLPVAGSDRQVWSFPLDLRLAPYIRDHRVQGETVLPGVAYLEMLMSAAGEALDGGTAELEDVEYRNAMFPSDDTPTEVQVVLSRRSEASLSCQVFSRPGGADAGDGDWTLHVTGLLRRARSASEEEIPSLDAVDRVRERCDEHVDGPELYGRFERLGNAWGPAFQGIGEVWHREGEALARIEPPEEIRPVGDAYRFHPALLDACCQVLAATRMPGEERDENAAFVLGSIRRFTVYRSPTDLLWSHALPGSVRDRDALEGDVEILDDAGRLVARVEGLRLAYLEADERPESTDDWLYELRWRVAERSEGAGDAGPPPGPWLVVAGDDPAAGRLAHRLEASGGEVLRAAPETGFEELFAAGGSRPRGVVYLADPGLPAGEATAGEVARFLRTVHGGCLRLIQALAGDGSETPARLWIVSRGAQAVAGAGIDEWAALQSPLWGLARTAQQEHPELDCTLVDLEPENGGGDVDDLMAELARSDPERQVAYRGGRRYVARLDRFDHDEHRDEDDPGRPAGEVESFELTGPVGEGLDRLRLRTIARRRPGRGEVELQVRAASLNFRDVLTATGLYPGADDGAEPSFGFGCAATVAAVGEGVTGLAEGDRVIAFYPGLFRTHAVVPAGVVAPAPPKLSFTDAATLPAAYLTAWHALRSIGRLQPGERVLIHSASGGVGQAAVRVARALGAEVFATAGRSEKRDFLREQGIDHVADSRSTGFSEIFREATGGEGVDVVLNSLTGDAITAGFDLLRPYGRFVELGKKDIVEGRRMGLERFADNRTFAAVDAVHMARHRPEEVGAVLREVSAAVEAGELEPLPVTVHPVAEAEAAFRTMSAARHVGRLVLDFDDRAAATVTGSAGPEVRADGAYLVTGGLGGLGLEVARWFAERGAGELILMGRTPLPAREDWDGLEPDGREARRVAAVRALEERGVSVRAVAADVADDAALRELLETRAAEGAAPIRGVVHAAGVIRFAPLQDLGVDDLEAVLRPKVLGGWVLDRVLRDQPLDFFVLFSSASALLSSPMLGIYSASNVYLDALAHVRRGRGEPALSVEWGFWEDVGMAARQSRLEARSIMPRGMGSFDAEQGLAVLEQLLGLDDVAQVAVMPVRWSQWIGAYPEFGRSPFVERMAAEAGSGATEEDSQVSGLLASLDDPGERAQVLADHMRTEVAKVLELPEAQVDADRSLMQLGLDSLMAVELKNRILRRLGVTIPIVQLLRGADIASLAESLSERPAETPPARPEPADGVENLSDDQVDALLADLVSEGVEA